MSLPLGAWNCNGANTYALFSSDNLVTIDFDDLASL
jgi:hypothetical protein